MGLVLISSMSDLLNGKGTYTCNLVYTNNDNGSEERKMKKVSTNGEQYI